MWSLFWTLFNRAAEREYRHEDGMTVLDKKKCEIFDFHVFDKHHVITKLDAIKQELKNYLFHVN